MAASDEGTHLLVRFFKRSLVQSNSFSDSSSSDNFLEEQKIFRKIVSQRRTDDAPSLDEILNSVSVLLIVGGAFVWLHQMFKFVNSEEAKRKAKISAKARARARAKRSSSSSANSNSGGNSSSNGCRRCGDNGRIGD